MADHLQPYHHRLLTDRALAAVYDDFVALLARYDIAATFAYVMAFVLDEHQRRQLHHLLERNRDEKDDWLCHYWEAKDRGQTEGWFQPHALEAVMADGRHEVACHGFCHRPLGDEAISPSAAEREMDAAFEAARMKGVGLSTLVFPRNQVGHLDVIRRKGFLGYRARRPRPAGAAGKLKSLIEEFDVWPEPDTPAAAPGELVRIPAGYFFNWRMGAKRAVPAAVTVRRWKSLLDKAGAKGAVAHLWLHPHNLITAPSTREPLQRVLAYAADLRDRGQIRILTQEAYCREMQLAH